MAELLNYGTVEEAFARLQNNHTIVTAMAASEPQLFYQNADRYLKNVRNARVYCANPSQSYKVFEDEDFLGHVDFRPLFLTASIRNHRRRPHVHYVPQHLSQWVTNLSQNPIDVFWGSCSLPDRRGFVSLGPSVCYERELLRRAKTSILEVNPHIPFTHGSTIVNIKQIDMILSSSCVLPTVPAEHFDSIDRTIAELVGELVLDGSTLQLGIGAIPNALSTVLESKRDLGAHTEMINDTICALASKGIITGRRKTLWPDKIVGSFAYGSKHVYDFIDGNPMVELHPSSIVNDAMRIGRNNRMVSINSAIEVDITGQVCSESIGHLELTGVGGAADTHIGAQKSRHGRGIIAMRSTTKNGESKIVVELKPGAKVSISRNDIDTVVTEYGIATLKGMTVAERAQSLVRLAHPNFRDELLDQARIAGYL